jgi:hypothetical protein
MTEFSALTYGSTALTMNKQPYSGFTLPAPNISTSLSSSGEDEYGSGRTRGISAVLLKKWPLGAQGVRYMLHVLGLEEGEESQA